MPQTQSSALLRAWQRLPHAVRERLLGGTQEVPTSRCRRYLLLRVLRELAPELRPALRERGETELTDEQAESIVRTLVQVTDRIDVAGHWMAGLRAAAEQAGKLPSTMEDRFYPAAWRASAEGGPDAATPEACSSILTELLRDDPDVAPPRFAAFRRLFADHQDVAALQRIIDEHWTDPPVKAAHVPDHLVAELLKAPKDANWDKLWDSYARTRPWESLSQRADRAGLSARAVPNRPLVHPPEGKHEGTHIPPLDRPLEQRLDWFLRSVQDHDEIASLTTRELCERAAATAGAPLGLADDELRAVLCLGTAAAGALSPDSVENVDQKLTPRLSALLTKTARTHRFVRESLRLGDSQHAPVRRALADPVFSFPACLWRVLHRETLLDRETAPSSRWESLVLRAARTWLHDMATQLKKAKDRKDPLPHEGLDVDGNAPLTLPAPQTDISPTALTTEQRVLSIYYEATQARGLTGRDLTDHIARLTDPYQTAWAVAEWDRILSAVNGKNDAPEPTASDVPFETAVDILRTFQSRHRLEGA
ncbi:hypothetical protein G3I62_27505 [Streptomyces sp. SID14446]|uniref:hypothetical protein n=2 Tax=Streptomyces TaxID=1883 RepID=UPI0013B86516|nr:hypothetical protein [Streptomyces sp. SID14446]NEB32794.1 hypothetical protein [Streptomyces sp. SID14446]